MKVSPVAIGVGLAGAGLAWYALGSSRKADVANEIQTALATDTRYPWRMRKYAQIVALAAADTLPSGLDPLTWGRILFGKTDRESLFGEALTPQNPSGTGDTKPRRLTRVKAAFAKQGKPGLADKLRIVTLHPVDGDPNDPLMAPGDGLGWGRGLAQVDWMWHEFARTGNWRDARANIGYGARELASAYGVFAGWKQTTYGPVRLALDAYNAGGSAVKWAVNNGLNPDSVTTGDDYGSDVLRRARLS